ncbi:MAG: gliding motility-associated C-terminal domain-containing protein, partial [Flavobacteriales bacterium]
FMIGSVCDSGALKYSYDSGATYMANPPDTLVYPPVDTNYTLFITDTNYTDTCYADVQVNVNKPELNATPEDTLICDNDSTRLFPTDSCYYVLDMQDAGNDGWSGGFIEVFVNGTSVGTFSATGGGTVDSFAVSIGDSIALEYTAGTSEIDNTYQVYDGSGSQVFSDGPTPATGVVFTQAGAVCGVTTPNYSPDWDPDSSLSNGGIQIPTAFPDTTTEYILTYENSSNSLCNVSDTTEVEVEPWGGNTTFDYGTGTFCWDDSAQSPTINGVEGGTFWSSPAGLDLDSSTGVIDVPNSAADSTYTVYYKTPGSPLCARTDSVPITIDTNSNADFHYADTTYCETAPPVSPTFLNNGSQGSFWTNKPGLSLDSITGTVDIPNSDTGAYWVYNEIPVSGSCPTDLDSARIVIEIEPEVSAGMDDTICSDQSHTLDGSYSGGSSQATWSSFGDGSFSDPNDTNATYTPGNADKNNGSVQLMIESDSIQACNVDRDTMLLTIQPEPQLDVGMDDTICVDGSKSLSAVLSGTGNGIQWGTTGDGFFDDTNATSTVYHPGSNDQSSGSVTLFTESQGSQYCSPATDSLKLTLQPLADPSFSYPDSVYCQGGSDPTPNIQGEGGGSFTVDPPGGLDIDSSSGEIDLSDSYADVYDVTYTTGGECPNDTTVTITIKPTPNAPTPAPFEVCPEETDSMTVNTSNVDSVVWYSDSNGTNVLDTDSTYAPPAQDLSQAGNYTYYVQTYLNGCPSPMGSVTVTVHPYADLGLTTVPSPAVGVKPFQVTFKNASGINVVDYQLSFGNGAVANLFTWSDTTTVYPKEGKYTVTLSGIDSVTGCPGSTELLVEVQSEPKAKLPNVFTPNGDGKNDAFRPDLDGQCPDEKKSGKTCWNGIKNFKGTIFNRWGNKIYQWDNWDDAWRGGNSSAGTYYYVIEALGENGEQVEYKGQVTLIRGSND